MECLKCHGDVWDNRAKKAEGKFKPNAPDFSCKDKGCGWNSGFGPKTAPQVPVQAPIVVPSAPQAQIGPSGRDGALVRLYWDCFDEILAGLKNRSLSTGFHDEQIAACVATLFIARSKTL